MRTFVVLLVVLSAVGFVQASTITLVGVTVNHQYQQTTNSPCVIGESSCQNPSGFGLTQFPNSVSNYNELSPVYTVAQIRAITGNGFVVGVDVNQTNVSQTLSLFEMLINGVVVDTYSASPATLVPPTVGGGNGNGYADYILTGFTSLSGLLDTDTIQFHVVMPLINDGKEQYFLISSTGPTEPVPEPNSLLLLGSGLVGLALWRFKR